MPPVTAYVDTQALAENWYDRHGTKDNPLYWGSWPEDPPKIKSSLS